MLRGLMTARIHSSLSRYRVLTVAVISSCLAALSACQSRDAARTTPAQPAAEIAFDIPALVGKSIDQIRQVCGAPQDKKPEPGKQQLALGIDEWDNTFSKDGQDLLVTYDPRTRRVIDFFLEGSDEALLMQRGNLVRNSTTYRVEPVRALADPSNITGLKVTPNR